MREPQVDRFCRCVKKVRKTLKARPGSTPDQGGIAVCTKSVLQTKGRTLKKVNCSKHILETQPIKAGRRTRKQRNETIERNKTHVVYVKDDTIKTPEQSERIMGLPVGQAEALGNICKVQGSETIEANYLAKVPFAAALVLFFGKKPQVDILGAKHPRGNLPIEKAKGFAIVNFSGDDLELDALCAHESTRGQGVGANTLKYIESMATLNGKKRVLLDALPAAVPFYVKQGYKNTRDNFYAKELVSQTGGVFRWMGADTPVFNNVPLKEWNGFPLLYVPVGEDRKAKEAQLAKWIETYNPVVRMVSSGDGEIPIHRMLKDMIQGKTPPFNEPFVTMHFNLWAGDGIYRADMATTYAMVVNQGSDEKTKKLADIAIRFNGFKWYGLVTRTQKMDVADLGIMAQRDAMCALLRVLLRIDGRIIHFDLHRRNMAVMFDGKPVIHDVGRMKIRDPMQTGAPFEVSRPLFGNKRILRNELMYIFRFPNYHIGYSQYFYIARMFKRIRKAYGETFPPPKIITNKLGMNVPIYVMNTEPPQSSVDRFEAWLDAAAGPNTPIESRRKLARSWLLGHWDFPIYTESGSVVTNEQLRDPKTEPLLYIDPVFETNYHQIARVFDILSVLKGISNAAKADSSFYYARKAAVEITSYLSAGYATKQEVEKIVRKFITKSGTENQCGGKTVAEENEYANKHVAGLASDPTRGNPTKPVDAAVPDVPQGAEAAAAAEGRAEVDEANANELENKLDQAFLVLDDTLPSEIKEASEKMIGPPEAEDAEVGIQEETKDESVDEKGPEGILMSPSDVEAEAKSGIAPPPGIKRLAPQDIELREPRTGDGIFRLDSSGNLIESPAAQRVVIDDSRESPAAQRVVIDDSRESPAAQRVVIDDSRESPAAQRIFIDDSRKSPAAVSVESPAAQRVVIDDSRESPPVQNVFIDDSRKSTGGRRTPKRKGLPRLL
jgi:GNAT superfamily N-acetyltransferase